ncbi:MAG: formate--tetrahydrofolate ligase [Thermoplasmata archaeon]|nr:formate--tetrahydrofolate ligase [Thermoplasmata archaeon]
MPLSDVEIAQSVELRPIPEIAEKIGLGEEDIEPWGRNIAKVSLSTLKRIGAGGGKRGRLVLVTTINPTPYGEGKTTVTIGLAQALARMGKQVSLGIREPSIGPTMGVKGGAAGGGYSQVLPMEDINLHFTGDMHAISTAHNLLAAMVNNHMHHGNELHLDPRRVVWKRVMDMNDRALRNVVVGLGGEKHGMPHESGFDITAASEIMAVLCLSSGIEDLKERLSRIIVGYPMKGSLPATAGELGAVGAMAALLKNAVKPNLVQTVEGTPAFVHGGPFANIAHGTSSLISTRLGLALSDFFITEAGFGSDLGAEKFFNIVSRIGGLRPAVAVVVVTTRALMRHGGGEGGGARLEAVRKGLCNLDKHIENIRMFNVTPVVAVNTFPGDREEEHRIILDHCRDLGVEAAVVDVRERGGEGGLELAELVVKAAGGGERFAPIYPLDIPIKEKIGLISTMIYGADRVVYTVKAEKDIAHIERDLDIGGLPVCMAKTQYSLSDDPLLLGRPKGFKITVKEVRVSAGAGFVIPFTGTITTMPGLPKHPAALDIDLDDEGRITGLF